MTRDWEVKARKCQPTPSLSQVQEDLLFPCGAAPLRRRRGRRPRRRRRGGLGATPSLAAPSAARAGDGSCRGQTSPSPRPVFSAVATALFSAVATVHSIAFSGATKFSCDIRCRSYSSTCTTTKLPPRSITSCSRAQEVSALSGSLMARSEATVRMARPWRGPH